MKGHILGPILFSIAATLSAPALAQTLNYYFTGVVDTVFDPLNKMNVAPGMSIYGYYAIDADTSDGASDPAVGQYEHFGFSITLGNVALAANSGEIVVTNGATNGTDSYGVRGGDIAFCSSHGEVIFVLVDETGAALSSDALPTAPLDVSLFETRDLLINFRCDLTGDIRIGGAITAVTNTKSPVELLQKLAAEITQYIADVSPVIDPDVKTESPEARYALSQFYNLLNLHSLSPCGIYDVSTFRFSTEGLNEKDAQNLVAELRKRYRRANTINCLKLLHAEVLNALDKLNEFNDSLAIASLEAIKHKAAMPSGKFLTKNQADSLISQVNTVIYRIHVP